MAESPVSRFRRRTSSHTLTLDVDLARTNGHLVQQPVDRDVIEEGQELFQNFVIDEIHKQGLKEPQNCFSPYCSTPLGYRNRMWAKTGKELRMLADDFSRTKERQKVQRKAQMVPVDSGVTYNEFRDLLTELFLREGLTQYRIIVLFFFCSDFAIRMLKNSALDIFRQCIDWSLRFISETICSWVYAHGGWSAVLSTSAACLSKLIIIGTIAMLSFGIYRLIIKRL